MKKIFIIIACCILFLTGCENKGNNNNNLLIKDTLSVFDAYNNLNWFYNDGNNDVVWLVNIEMTSNNIFDYTNHYSNINPENINYYMSFRTTVNDNSEILQITFKKEYSFNSIMQKYNDYKSYEEEYNGYKIFTDNYLDCILIWKELEPSHVIKLELTKQEEKDNLDNYRSYYQHLLDTLTVKKYNKNQLKNTTYLTLFPQGWYSLGGGHLYLNSSKIKFDENLTLDLTGYSVATTGNNVLGRKHAKYGFKIMKDVPRDDKKISYFDFDIIYVEKNNDGYYDEYFVKNNLKLTASTINGIKFDCYKNAAGNKVFYKYEVSDGYYLIANYSSKEAEFIAELEKIIQ